MHFGFNNLTTITALDFPALKLLNLENNKLSQWSQVDILLHIKTLSHLNISNNLISCIEKETTSKSLETLNISNNQISNLSSASVISTIFPRLSNIRFKGNPIPELDFYTTVAIFPSASVVDGCTLTTRDRLDAELYYITRHVNADDGGIRQRLIDLHQPVVSSVEPNGKGIQTVNLMIDSVSVKVPVNIGIGSLKRIAARAIKVKGKFDLVCNGETLEVQRDLMYYGITGGDSLSILKTK